MHFRNIRVTVEIEALQVIYYTHIFGNTKAQCNLTQVFLTIINMREKLQRKGGKEGLVFRKYIILDGPKQALSFLILHIFLIDSSL